ncbi:hypothetical protein [Lentzea kentuckyensis]|uniref:hypothetical protein n=1 Tax=Lentzea kentuckyensis TaxID=360086 RepID=UPI000A38AF5C|nr:hypothetical protein [Lentzea kentuckyensis]
MATDALRRAAADTIKETGHTWISEALLPHLRTMLTGAWDSSEIIRRAIAIRDGTILTPRILSFQHRSSEHPHAHV